MQIGRLPSSTQVSPPSQVASGSAAEGQRLCSWAQSGPGVSTGPEGGHVTVEIEDAPHAAGVLPAAEMRIAGDRRIAARARRANGRRRRGIVVPGRRRSVRAGEGTGADVRGVDSEEHGDPRNRNSRKTYAADVAAQDRRRRAADPPAPPTPPAPPMSAPRNPARRRHGRRRSYGRQQRVVATGPGVMNPVGSPPIVVHDVLPGVTL